MDFQKAPDTINITHRMTSGRIEIGVYRVLYGYRVRAGFIGNEWTELDYCCGDDPKWVKRVYAVVLTILSARDEDKAFVGFPMQRTKPMIKDRVCFVNMLKMLEGKPPMEVDLDIKAIDETNMFNIEDMFK